jgi:beta-galactosidase GanA
MGGGMQGLSPVGVTGYCEILEVDPTAEVIARFKCDEPLLDGRPAATLRMLGKGSVIKLAFWPQDDSVARLIRRLDPAASAFFAQVAPPGVQAVPRADGSMFIVNTMGKAQAVQFTRPVSDRLSGRTLRGVATLKKYDVLWVE